MPTVPAPPPADVTPDLDIAVRGRASAAAFEAASAEAAVRAADSAAAFEAASVETAERARASAAAFEAASAEAAEQALRGSGGGSPHRDRRSGSHEG